MEEERPAPQPRRRTRKQRLRTTEFSAGGVLGKGFAIWAKSLPTLLLLTLFVYSPLLIYKGYELAGERPFVDRVNFWGEIIAGLLLGFLATAAVIYAVFQRLRGERASVLGGLRTVLVRILPVMGAAILLAVAVALPLGLAGLLAVLHPAAGLLGTFFYVYVYCMLWMMVPAVVVERASPFTAFKRSVALTHRNKLRIFLVLLAVWAIRLGVNYVIRTETSGDTSVVLELAAMLVGGSLEATMNAVAYHDLRQAKEGVGVDVLLKVFD
jgi:hypothetical protein